ncbi:MAG: hypothetical protein H6706_01700 [Myxococcales bacterium]|nr:hypothetical protein [Myxococcales bacterium]
MPAFAARPADERWALVAYLLRQRGPVVPLRRAPPPGLPAIPDPLWPPGDPAANRLEGLPILTTGAARQCGRCHPAQEARWATSRHALARGPGLLGQYHGRDAAFRGRCDACHGPVEGGLDAVGCASCHVRDHQKLGLGRQRDARVRLPMRVEPRLGRADFCLPCHQLPPEAAVDGRPLLDTWREWAASPYLPAGIQCQHCHVPGGDHAFAGAHDPEAVRRALRLDVTVRGADPVDVGVTLRNVGAGHHFPTTATPRAVLRVRLRRGGRVVGEERLWAIGRTMEHGPQGWRTTADTRIAAGGEGRWSTRLPRLGADAVDVSVSFFPDWHYARVFRAAVAGLPAGAPAAADLAAALQAAETSGFLVEQRHVDLP